MNTHWRIIFKDGYDIDDDRVKFIEIIDGVFKAKTCRTGGTCLYLIPESSVDFCEWVEGDEGE